MISISINGNPVQFPTTVYDLTCKQFFGLKNAKDMLDELSILTGIPRHTIDNFKDLRTINAAQALLATLQVSIAGDWDARTFPKSVMLGFTKIKIPNELRLQPIGAFMSVNDILAAHNNKMVADATAQGRQLRNEDINYTDCIPRVLAHYFYLPYHGDDALYSDLKAEAPDYMDKILNLPFTQAVALGNFFFLKFPNLI